MAYKSYQQHKGGTYVSLIREKGRILGSGEVIMPVGLLFLYTYQRDNFNCEMQI